jgi:protein O-mannosyl-transferase
MHAAQRMTKAARSRQARLSSPSGHASVIALVVGLTLLAFWPVIGSGFVNWDDPTVIVQNPQLTAPGVVSWAFSTTLIGHYQPLSWLAWAALARTVGLNSMAFHVASLLGHLANAVLVYAVARKLTGSDVSEPRARLTGAVAAMAFAVHPMRVEAVAWASALPYVLSTAALLVAFLSYLHSRLNLAIVAYAMALLCRPTALAFPILLLAIDVYPSHRRIDRRALLEKLPFAVLAGAAAVIEFEAREIASMQDVGVGARLTMAVSAPFVYLARTIVPLRLSPLNPLPVEPTIDWVRLALGSAGLAAVAIVAWRMRRKRPGLVVATLAYLLLLAPVVGLTPTGLQATADRYMYVPGIVISLLVGMAVAEMWPRTRWTMTRSFVTLAAPVVALSVLTWQQARWWHDSITLWARVAELDPANDIATYNLAIALSDAGRDEEAIGRYEQTLRIVPDQRLARQNLQTLQARQSEREGDRLADAGRLDEAERAYARALALDTKRVHARAARAVVLTRLGRTREAVPDLRAAHQGDPRDAAVLNALAFALSDTGESAEAAAVLKRGIDLHPDDVNLAHNLARLLATATDPVTRDGVLALQLATRVNERTGRSDPRVLDTLAAAYAATGQVELARETAQHAVARARQIGDHDLAREIEAHTRDYPKQPRKHENTK